MVHILSFYVPVIVFPPLEALLLLKRYSVYGDITECIKLH